MKVLIDYTLNSKIKIFAEIASVEISGMGICVLNESGSICTVSKIVLPTQTNGPTSTDLSAEAIGKAVEELILAGEDPSNLKFWWHSHCDMNCFWSSTDESAIEDYIKDSGWLLSMVVNKKGDSLCRIDTCKPRLTLHDVKIDIIYSYPLTLVDECKAEFGSKVTETKTYNYNNNYIRSCNDKTHRLFDTSTYNLHELALAHSGNSGYIPPKPSSKITQNLSRKVLKRKIIDNQLLIGNVSDLYSAFEYGLITFKEFVCACYSCGEIMPFGVIAAFSMFDASDIDDILKDGVEEYGINKDSFKDIIYKGHQKCMWDGKTSYNKDGLTINYNGKIKNAFLFEKIKESWYIEIGR